MSRPIHPGSRPTALDASLCSLHCFGSLVIALHDGKLLAVGVAMHEAKYAAKNRRNRGTDYHRPVVSWAGGR